VQAQDRYMNCAEIADEVEANNQKVAGLVSEKGLKTTVSAMWFGMDWLPPARPYASESGTFVSLRALLLQADPVSGARGKPVARKAR
jgi:hypothetical protein